MNQAVQRSTFSNLFKTRHALRSDISNDFFPSRFKKKTAFLTISKDLSNHVAKSDLVGTDPGSNLGVHTGFSRFIF